MSYYVYRKNQRLLRDHVAMRHNKIILLWKWNKNNYVLYNYVNNLQELLSLEELFSWGRFTLDDQDLSAIEKMLA